MRIGRSGAWRHGARRMAHGAWRHGAWRHGDQNRGGQFHRGGAHATFIRFKQYAPQARIGVRGVGARSVGIKTN